MHTTKYLLLSRVARRLDVALDTVHRWRYKGLGPRGVQLRCVKIGGRWRTRWGWVKRFQREVAESRAIPEIETPADRRRRLDLIEAELDAMGVRA